MTKDCKVRRIQKLCFNAALTAFLASVGLFLFASDKAYAAGTTYSITYYENTVSNYTKNAQKFLDANPIIRGINGTELVELVLQYYEKLSDKNQKVIPLKKVYIPVLQEDME